MNPRDLLPSSLCHFLACVVHRKVNPVLGPVKLCARSQNAAGFSNLGNARTVMLVITIPDASPLKWKVRFLGLNPNLSPDFTFDMEFQKYIAAKDAHKLKEVLPSWCNWEKENPQALKLCLGEFLHLYSDYQREKLQGNPKFHALFEVIERLNIKEYFVRKLECEVQIGIMLPVPRLTELVEISQDASHFAEQESVVWIKCNTVGDELEVHSVMPSPLVLAALGESTVEFSRPRTVSEYFRTFVPQMQKKVEILVASRLKAFEVLSELGSTFPDHVTRVTRDISQGSLSISLMFQSCKSSLTFDIVIPNEFPLRKPTVVERIKDTEHWERKVEYEYNSDFSGEEIGREICYSIARMLEELD